MNESHPLVHTGHIVTISWPDRWQVYQRLQELNIPCSCQTNEPLRVKIENIGNAIQYKSVLKQFTSSPQELQQWLNQCWQLN